jgi:hypothetical protein
LQKQLKAGLKEVGSLGNELQEKPELYALGNLRVISPEITRYHQIHNETITILRKAKD